MSVNIGEYGMTLRMNSGINLQGQTLTIVLKSPKPYIQCKEKTEADGITVGNVPIQTESGIIFPTNEYINYVIQRGDLDMSGTWLAKLYAQTMNEERCSVSDWVPFIVEE